MSQQPPDINGFAPVGRVTGIESCDMFRSTGQVRRGDVLLFVGPVGPREGLVQVQDIWKDDDGRVVLKRPMPLRVTVHDWVYVAGALGERAFKVRA